MTIVNRSIAQLVQDRREYGRNTDGLQAKLNYGLGRFVAGVVHGYFLGRDLHAQKEPIVSYDRFEQTVRKYLVLTSGDPLLLSAKLPKLYEIVLRADAKTTK